ncbi:hypothetical protein HDE_04271 [Halotydeus destructor]|nr:hypothetical protein HDE_04271 [Halotydeus destructor]
MSITSRLRNTWRSVPDRPFKPLEDTLIRGYLIPASICDIRNGSTTFKQHFKVDLMTVAVILLLVRYYAILLVTDKKYHKLLGYLFSRLGIQGKYLIGTLTFFVLMSIGFKVVTRRQIKDKTLEHLFDMIPLITGGDDKMVSRKVGLMPINLTAFKFRVKIANIAMSAAAVYFPLSMTLVNMMALFISLSHEHDVIFMVNYSFWAIAIVYLVYVMTCVSSGSYICWYIGTQFVILRLRQVNDYFMAIRDNKLETSQLDAILDEQKRVIAKVHRYDIVFKSYIFILVFICSPLLGTVLFVTIYAEFELQLIRTGIIMITNLSVLIIWFTSSKTADVNVEESFQSHYPAEDQDGVQSRSGDI